MSFMFDGMVIFTPSCKLSDTSFMSPIAGKVGFRIFAIAFVRFYKTSLILVDFHPVLSILSLNPILSSISKTVSFSTFSKNLVVSFVLVKYA